MKPHAVSTRRDGQRGNAMIEFGLALGVLTLLFAGVYQWAYTFYIYNNVESNVRSGARYAAQKAFTTATGSTAANPVPCAAYINEVRNVVVFGNPDGTGTPVAPGLTAANVDVDGLYDASGVPQSIRVRISQATPYQLNAIFATMNLAGKPSVRFPYTGIYSPASPCGS